MVRVTAVLARVPVIRFRKGGPGGPAPPAAAAAGGAAAPAAASAPAATQASAPMSTQAIPDVDLPPRYRRQPLSQEEIDHINGGGIV